MANLIMILSLGLVIVFVGLGLIHIFWLAGGKWGLSQAIPADPDGVKVMQPGWSATLMVGLGLFGFALFYGLRSGMVDFLTPDWVLKYIGWVIPGIFLFRAVGDFRYVGFFKRIRNTEFGRWDSRLFSPLCLAIAVVGITIQLLA